MSERAARRPPDFTANRFRRERNGNCVCFQTTAAVVAETETANEGGREKEASLSSLTSLSPAHAATVSKVKGGRRERRVLIRPRFAELMW